MVERLAVGGCQLAEKNEAGSLAPPPLEVEGRGEGALPTHIRRAEIADIPELIELAGRIWRAHYPGIISVEQVEYMLADRYTPDVLTKLISDKDSLYLVAEDDESRPVGRASLEPRPMRESAGERGGKIKGFCFVTNKQGHGIFFDQCYVEPKLHGSGIGGMFMDAAIDFARNTGKIKLQVNRCNVKAINFYFRHGFTIERVNELDIGGGFFMNDFIMVKNI